MTCISGLGPMITSLANLPIFDFSLAMVSVFLRNSVWVKLILVIMAMSGWASHR